jgi:hypothetical protein
MNSGIGLRPDAGMLCRNADAGMPMLEYRCQNVDAGLTLFTDGKNADAELFFPRHSGVYL